MMIRAEGPQTLPIVLLAGAKPQDFCCPSFQLLLQVCRHFDAEPRLDTWGSSGIQYRFSCQVLLEVSRTPEEETEEDISLKLFFFFFPKSPCKYSTFLPDFCCPQLKH